MFSDTIEANVNAEGVEIQIGRDIGLAVADVLGRVDKVALRSAGDTVRFSDVFNCLASLRYIAYESGETMFMVTTWDNARLAGFMDLIIREKVEGISPNQREREAMQLLITSLRTTDEQHRS